VERTPRFSGKENYKEEIMTLHGNVVEIHAPGSPANYTKERQVRVAFDEGHGLYKHLDLVNESWELGQEINFAEVGGSDEQGLGTG
jgi:hypothetical protein